MQSLERDPSTIGGWSKPTSTPAHDQTTSGFGMAGIDSKDLDETDKQQSRRSNPRKYMLYRPSFAQVIMFLATCFKDISENSAILLYLSADGSKNSRQGEYSGGVSTALTRKPSEKSEDVGLINTLHPHDLLPFTRKPLFVIIDSNNSTVFSTLPRIFSQPLVCFMSPVEYPPSLRDTTQIGSLFSLFLHSPLKAFAFVSDLGQVNGAVRKSGLEVLEKLEAAVEGLLIGCESLGELVD